MAGRRDSGRGRKVERRKEGGWLDRWKEGGIVGLKERSKEED